MSWFGELFFGYGVAHSILMLALVIAAGVVLATIKIKGVSLGVTWILFAGVACAHFGMRVDRNILHIFQEFGLILFVYSIGLQMGPGFFSSFKKGGVTLNMLAAGVVLLGVAVTCVIHLLTDIPIPTMVGIMSGAATNTPGLGAAQQAAMDVTGVADPEIATGYAVAYPLAVVGIIGTILFLRYAFRVNLRQEEDKAMATDDSRESSARRISLRLTNPLLDGKTVGEIHDMLQRDFVISRIRTVDGTVKMVNANTVLHTGDNVLIITSQPAVPAIATFIGEEVVIEWQQLDAQFISRRILITKSGINGKTLSQLRLRSFGVSITRVNRSGIDLVAGPSLPLQIGDRVTVVGPPPAIAEVEKILGNSLKRLDHPNVFPIFIGIVLGVILGSIPFVFPGIPQPVKLGLAGGPLVVAILVSRFGPKYKMVTYTNDMAGNDIPAVGYATVYPLTMFMRVLCAQLMILMLA